MIFGPVELMRIFTILVEMTYNFPPKIVTFLQKKLYGQRIPPSFINVFGHEKCVRGV